MQHVKAKFPKTHHVPWSLGIQSDDKVLKFIKQFYGEEIVVTEKMDGENTTLAHLYYHARSLDSAFNWTRSWVAKMHSVLRFDIPEDMKFVGENMFAEHAIRYPDGFLEGYFYLFSAWKDLQDGTDYCLDYDETVEYAELLDLPMPRVIDRFIFDEKTGEKRLRDIALKLDRNITEGYVIRTVKGFHRKDFKKHTAKYVRSEHVQPDSEHWLAGAVQNGKLAEIVKPYYMG